MYNVFNGSGDNLYGIEPVSYYIKNLFLNLGLAWPVALAWPLIAIVNKLSHKQDSTTKIELMDGFSVTILFASLLWLAVLFSRPHKVSVVDVTCNSYDRMMSPCLIRCIGRAIHVSCLSFDLFCCSFKCRAFI